MCTENRGNLSLELVLDAQSSLLFLAEVDKEVRLGVPKFLLELRQRIVEALIAGKLRTGFVNPESVCRVVTSR